MEAPVLQELPVEVRNTLRTGVMIPNMAQCIVELILNSLDAGASSVAIRVNLIYHKLQVVDNGCGMDLNSLNLVGLRYMTSKCTSLEDLRKYLGLFGFRGEALASLRNVSKVLTIESRPHGCDDTFYKVFKKGKAHGAIKSDSKRPSRGTTVTVHDFLYNMPVRQQRTNDSIDLEEIKSLIESIALAHSDVSFSLRNDVNGSIILQTQRTYDTLKTFASLFGEDISKSLVSIKHRSNKFKIKGHISREAHHPKHLQFIYVNKRVVRKTKLHTLVNAKLAQSSIRYTDQSRPNVKRKSNGNWIAYTPPAKKDKFPVYMLNIKCAAIEYDICSDPKKTLIEFLDWSSVLKCLDEALQTFLEAESLVEIKEATCVSAVPEVQDSISDQAAIQMLKCYEGPVMEIGRCIRSRPAIRLEKSKDVHHSSPFSPNNSLAKALEASYFDAIDDHISDKTNQSFRNMSTVCRSPEVNVGKASSSSSVASNQALTNSEFTPAPLIKRCPLEDPFPSTFEKILSRKKIRDPKVRHKRPSSLSSLSEDPIGKEKVHTKAMGRVKRSLRVAFHSFKKQPLKITGTLSEDPMDGFNWNHIQIPPNQISRRKHVLNKIAKLPKFERSNAIMPKASVQNPLHCNKHTPVNGEGANVGHVFCHPLLTNVEDNPAFVRLQDAIRLDKLSIALKKCSSRLKRKGVLRIRETEITINQRIEITPAIVDKTPQEIFNSLRSPYFTLNNAKDFAFKVPNVNHLISSRFKNKNKPASLTTKTVHRSPYFTSPPKSGAENRNGNERNFNFMFCRQPPLVDQQPASTRPHDDQDRRLNLASNQTHESAKNEIEPKRKSYRTPNQRSTTSLSLENCYKHASRANADHIDTLGIMSIDTPRYRYRLMSPNIPKDIYVSSSDMIRSLHRSSHWRSDRGHVEERDPATENNQRSHVQSLSYNQVFCNEQPFQDAPASRQKVTFTQSLEQTKAIENVNYRSKNSKQLCQVLSPIYEDDREKSPDNYRSKMLSIDQRLSSDGDNSHMDNSVTDLECTLRDVSLDSELLSIGFSSNSKPFWNQQQATVTSDSIIFPSAEVEFLSSDESAQNEEGINGTKQNSAPRDAMAVSFETCLEPRGDSPVSPLPLSNQHNSSISEKRKNEQSDAQIVAKRHKQTDTTNSQRATMQSGVNVSVCPRSSQIAGSSRVQDDCKVNCEIPERVTSDNISLTHTYSEATGQAMDSFNSDEDIIPSTPHIESSYVQPSQTITYEEPTVVTTEPVKEIEKEWVKMFDGGGRAFFVHVRSGMTSFEPPVAVKDVYSMTKRYGFLPKGMSPILEDKSNGEKVRDLSQGSRDNVQKAVLDAGQAQEDLSAVKWRSDCGDGESIIEKIREFSEKNGKYCEASVPDAYIHGRNAVKIYSLISSFTFTKEIFRCINLLGQLDKKFIVAIVNPASNGLPHLLVFFDQHAVHERIRLETLMKDYHIEGSDTHFKSSAINPQISITLSQQESRMVSSFGDEFQRVGLELAASCGTGFVVTSVPTCLKLRADRDAACRRAATLQTVVENLVREQVAMLLEASGVGARVPTVLQNIINSEACRGAIKFGDVLSYADCLDLLTQLCQCDLPFQCAHGRPSIVPIADLRQILKTEKIQPKPNYSNLKKYLD